MHRNESFSTKQFAAPDAAAPVLAGPDYLRAIFSLKQYSSMQDRGAQRRQPLAPGHAPTGRDSHSGPCAQVAEPRNT